MRTRLPDRDGYAPGRVDGSAHDRRVLGDILMDGLHIWATCRHCRHRASLSPLGLAKRLGYDRSLAALRRHLRCSKCGERKVELRMIEPERR
jgi:hypothetical protein